MKRLLIFVFALTLCLAGCKEEPKTPDVPEVKPHVEVEAPLEETKEATNENNAYIFTFDFDGVVYDFLVERPNQYVTPTFVDANEFDWGEYFPVVGYTINKGKHVEQYLIRNALLTPNTKRLDEENLLKKYDSFIENAEEKNNCVITSNYGENISSCIDVSGIFDNHFFIANIFFPEEFTNATYLFDLKENTAKLLILQANTISISPDGKYIAYSSPFADEWSLSDANIDGTIEQGFYIKNIKTEETVFYSCEDICNPYCAIHSIEGWIHSNNLYS